MSKIKDSPVVWDSQTSIMRLLRSISPKKFLIIKKYAQSSKGRWYFIPPPPLDWHSWSHRFLHHSASRSHQNKPHQLTSTTLSRHPQKDNPKWVETVHARQVFLSLSSSVAVIRQAYGFTVYTQLLSYLENHIARTHRINKFLNYSISAVSAKLMAMVFEAPLTLLKTRVELVSSRTLLEEFNIIANSPLRDSVKGLGSSIAR